MSVEVMEMTNKAPTQKQIQYLMDLGYNGPTPQTMAEASQLINMQILRNAGVSPDDIAAMRALLNGPMSDHGLRRQARAVKAGELDPAQLDEATLRAIAYEYIRDYQMSMRWLWVAATAPMNTIMQIIDAARNGLMPDDRRALVAHMGAGIVGQAERVLSDVVL